MMKIWRITKMAKCSICNRRWFFSSKVKCNCKAEQLKVRAAILPATRSVQHTNYNNNTDVTLLAMHQQNINQMQHSDVSEPCRIKRSSEYRIFDSSPSHCNSSHDSSSSSSLESSSSYDSGSSSSSSWD